MKLCVYLFTGMALLAIAAPAQAFLGAKLSLLGALKNGIGGEGFLKREFGGGYDNGLYHNLLNNHRPVYTGRGSNYGWGPQSYGAGYGGYNGANEDNVKVIKVIVNHEQPQVYYDNYARISSRSSAASVATSSGSTWTAHTPIVQTYTAQPIPTQAHDIPVQLPAQAPLEVTTPLQVIVPPPRPQYQYVKQVQPVYQYPVQQPNYQQPQHDLQPPATTYQPVPQQPVYQQEPVTTTQSFAQGQQGVRTVNLNVDGEGQHVPAQTYGPPAPATVYVTPSAENGVAWNSNSWSKAGSGNGWHNIGAGPWKKGSIWDTVGC